MARPREFDRDAALRQAVMTFWSKGYAATSTDDLLRSMGIGRQSLYNAFGDKRTLYLEALRAYQQTMIGEHLSRLTEPASPLEGVRALLTGLAQADDQRRALGCLGVGSVGEFGTADPDVTALHREMGPVLVTRLAERLREGQARGEVDPDFDVEQAASFVQMTMTGIQVAARGGAGSKDLQVLAEFAVDRLRARPERV